MRARVTGGVPYGTAGCRIVWQLQYSNWAVVAQVTVNRNIYKCRGTQSRSNIAAEQLIKCKNNGTRKRRSPHDMATKVFLAGCIS